ncbi:hypothetical protein [Kineococcus sp. R86509]|uniref:hypothetical protein n=1 Tax=Kineococcus sp. R86509 TaxID=3093851 RepID=UPI0036D40C20
MVLWEIATALVPIAVALAAVAISVLLMVRQRRHSLLALFPWAVVVVAAGWWLVKNIELADATDGGSGLWGAWPWLIVAVVVSAGAMLVVHLPAAGDSR